MMNGNPATLAPYPTSGFPAGAFWGGSTAAMQPAAPGNNLSTAQSTASMSPRTLIMIMLAVLGTAYVLFHWHYLKF